MKLIKKLVVVAAVLVILLVVGVVVLLTQINAIARKGIEAGSTYALGVTTTLDSVNIGLFSGKFAMSGLNVANPQGFAGPHFLKLGEGGIAVSLGSLSKDLIEVPSFSLADLDVRLEKKSGSSNYGVILENLGKLSSGKPAGPEKPSDGGEKKFVINDLSIRNVKVHVELMGAGSPVGDVLNKATSVDVPIKEIKLSNVGRTGTGVAGSGVTVGQLSSIIVQAVLSATMENGGGLLPADMLGDLKGTLGKLDGLKGMGLNSVSGVAAQAGKVAEQATESAKKAVDEGKKAIEGVKGLEGLIPGKK